MYSSTEILGKKFILVLFEMMMQDSSSLSRLPPELLTRIAHYINPYSILSFALVCRSLYHISRKDLARHKDLCRELHDPQMSLAELLVAILDEPRKRDYILKYTENYNGVGADVNDDDESDEGWDSEFFEADEDNQESFEALADRTDAYNMQGGSEPNWNHYSVVWKLYHLLEISADIPESSRAQLVETLKKSSCHPFLIGLLVQLCPMLSELKIQKGQNASTIMQLWPAGAAAGMTNLKKLFLSARGFQEVRTELGNVLPFLEIGGLQTLQLENVFSNTEKEQPGPIARSLCNIEMRNCQIAAGALNNLLALVHKPQQDHVAVPVNVGLRALIYEHGWGTMSPMDGSVPLQTSELVATIQKQVGTTLQMIEIGCSQSCWMLLSNYDVDEHDFSLDRERNLREGFPWLKEVILGPEFLVCEWRCPTHIGPRSPEIVDNDVESLPLSLLLPQTLEVLRLRNFNVHLYPVAAPIVLRKLVEHVRDEIASTPKLREVYLEDTAGIAAGYHLERRTDEEFTRMLEKFEQDLHVLTGICDSKNVSLFQNVKEPHWRL